MSRKYRVLFLNQASTGHVNTLLAMALQMRKEGHYVRFLLPGTKLPLKRIQGLVDSVRMFQAATAVPRSLDSYDLPYDIITVPVTVGLQSIMLPYATGYGETRYAFDLMSRGMGHYTRHIVNYLEQDDFDVLVSDFAFPASHIAAEITGVPCAVVFHSGLPFKGDGVPPFGSGLSIGGPSSPLYEECLRVEKQFLGRLDKRLNNVRRKWGLPPFPKECLREPYSHWLNLVVSASAIEAPRSNLTDNTFFVGPCFGNRAGLDNEFPFSRLRNDKFKIYVSLGSVFNNKPDVFRTIMHGLDQPEYQVIISAGSAYDAFRNEQIPDNVLLFPWVPQVALLPEVDMVIGHGGNNSTNETLAAGKPLIVVPIGGEQGDNARRIEYLGAGLRVDLSSLTKQVITDTVGRIRADSGFQLRSARIKKELDKTDGAETASKLIQRLAQTKAPLKRPPSIPLTITVDDYPSLDASWDVE